MALEQSASKGSSITSFCLFNGQAPTAEKPRNAAKPTLVVADGLWPNYNDGSWPSCCTNDEFDMKEISTLRNGLENYWPSLSCSSPTTCHGQKGSFWAHEWEKHGTCAYPVIKNEYDYFQTALNLYLKYNVTKVLTEAGYAPSDSEKYPLGGIISAIENAFHMTPLVVCSDGTVEELRLCFYKDLKSPEIV